jgi:hypothetical protein
MEVSIMAHYAKLDENNVVTHVVVVRNEDCLDNSGKESEQVGIKFLKTHLDANGKWVKTSYGSIGNVHYNHSSEGNSPSGKPAFRKNYATIGGTYDNIRDAFIPPKPPDDPNNPDRYIIDETTCLWVDTLRKNIKMEITRI